MAKFRKKPTIIEAAQLLEGKPFPPGVNVATKDGSLYVVTAQGRQVAVNYGEWIIAEPGDSGLYYPCHPEIFADRYEPVGSGDNG